MSKKVTKDEILREVMALFPFVEMPPSAELAFHQEGCVECENIRSDLESYRGRDIAGEAIRMIHQELSLLSAKAWRWILPHYLRFCLTSEGEYNQMETEFLIYNLGPSVEFESETELRLSCLDSDQLNCLIHFLKWCLKQEFWHEFYAERLNDAINFLHRADLHRRESIDIGVRH